MTFTDGHVDGLACFVAPGVVLALMPADPAHPKYEIYAENLRALELATDARGAQARGPHHHRRLRGRAHRRALHPHLRQLLHRQRRDHRAGYGVASDETARQTIQGLFPGYEVVTVQAAKVAGAGGAIHCITQQQPRCDGISCEGRERLNLKPRLAEALDQLSRSSWRAHMANVAARNSLKA